MVSANTLLCWIKCWAQWTRKRKMMSASTNRPKKCMWRFRFLQWKSETVRDHNGGLPMEDWPHKWGSQEHAEFLGRRLNIIKNL